MSPRSPQRTAGCSKADAAVRLEQARKFYEAAELVQTEAAVDLLRQVEPGGGEAAANLATFRRNSKPQPATTTSGSCVVHGTQGRAGVV